MSAMKISTSGLPRPKTTRKKIVTRIGARLLCAALLLSAGAAGAQDTAVTTSVPSSADFDSAIERRLAVPGGEVKAYAKRLQQALEDAGVAPFTPQFVVLVDRNPNVQAALLFRGSKTAGWNYVGATPVSTGLPGTYQHFVTPLGVFEHAMTNPDYRAEGTKNKLGFRGYGRKGLRVYDFGWIETRRGWGDHAMGKMRLQMHSTDAQLAEPLLGTPRSEGCVRIPASLNDFIDKNGLLDEDYLRPDAGTAHQWVMRTDRTPTATPGRYMIVVDTQRQARPGWAALTKATPKVTKKAQ